MMRLDTLMQEAGVRATALEGRWADVEVRAVVADSRKVGPGALFVACSGARSRGVSFADQAVAAGAVALVVDEPFSHPLVPVLQVSDARATVGPLAAALLGHPSRHMKVIGVTGTNGKTTTSVLIAQLLTDAGLRAAAIGTLGVWTPEGTRPGALTTPEAPDLQRLFAELLAEGFTHVAMEVSSHAVDQHRVAGVRFATAAWTNLSRDHLDYHGTMQAYAAAKARLFTDLLPPDALGFVNADDPFSRAVHESGHALGWTFADAPGAEIRVELLRSDADGIGLRIHSADGAFELYAPLVGRHNAENLVAAALTCRALGLDETVIAKACRTLRAPRGRLEPVPNGLGALVVVDYAHTPDALEKAFAALRPLVAKNRKLVAVFGCGGDRDQGKRPLMGEVSARLADLSIATSDNPRSEQPLAILGEIERGLVDAGAVKLQRLVPSALAALNGRAGYAIEVDRDLAIQRAVGVLQMGDVLVIAGKGHEVTQTMGSEVRPFDDAAVAAGWLAQRRTQSTAASTSTGFAFTGPSAHAATGGALRVAGRRTTHVLCTDSRLLEDGALFVALPGERFDGADFLAEAVTRGAAGLVCAQGRGDAVTDDAETAGAFLIEVADPLLALGDLARAHRLRFEPLVVGVTGSNGKTTTKELTALALASLGPVLATRGNFNNRIGVPLTLAGLAPQHRAAVVEMGMSEPGEIAELCRQARPQLGVVTSVAEAHLGGLGSIEHIADEKAALLRSLPADGVAIVPADEPLLLSHAAGLSCRVIRFGQTADADVRPDGAVTVDGLSQRFTANVAGTRVEVVLPGLGVHLAHNALGALAVALAAGADLHAAAQALSRYVPVGQRMLPSRIGNWLVLEDCYNANPRSTEVALDTLATLPGPRVAVLGSMLELGPTGPALHTRVGAHAGRIVDLLVILGDFSAAYASGARSTGLDAASVAVVADPAAAAQAIAARFPGTATLLVKGSRGARMERVVAELRALAPEPIPGPEAEPGRS